MLLSKMISEEANIMKNESVLTDDLPTVGRHYKQNYTLADMPLGRIRRRGLPFRRPFSL